MILSKQMLQIGIYYILWLFYVISSLNCDHITGTTFLQKIVLSVNLQKLHIKSTSNVGCNKNNTKLMFNPSVETTFIVFGRILVSDSSSEVVRYLYTKTNHACVLSRQIDHSFVLVILSGLHYQSTFINVGEKWSKILAFTITSFYR